MNKTISLNTLQLLSADVASMAMSLPQTSLFGTDGIRGTVGELLTASLAFQVGFWAGQVLQANNAKSSPIILGQDSRNSSNMLAMAVAEGFNTAGVEVWHLGLCPTPAVAYLANTLETMGGVMISASHNPPEDNGIKFFAANGIKLASHLQEQIEAEVRNNWELTSDRRYCLRRQYYRPELLNKYLNSLQQPLLPSNLNGMRIVLDLACGAAVGIAPIAFQAMGAEVICLHNHADGDRINVNCGSTHLVPLQTAVLQHQADLGFAFDGDADRVMAVDSQGRVVDGDYILYFWGQALRQQQKLPNDTIIATVMANLGFERAWQSSGGNLIRTKVGDRHVQEAMRRMGATLGGEQSGHILCSHYGVSGDGLLTALHLAALVRENNTSLSELVDNSFQTYPQILKNVRVIDRERRLNWQNCDALQQAISKAETAMGDKGRVLVRASGTEPVIRVMVEAEDDAVANYWTENLVSAVQDHLAS